MPIITQLALHTCNWSIKPSLVLIFSTLVIWLHLMSHMQWAPSSHMWTLQQIQVISPSWHELLTQVYLRTNHLCISHLNTLVHLGCHLIIKTKQGPFTRPSPLYSALLPLPRSSRKARGWSQSPVAGCSPPATGTVQYPIYFWNVQMKHMQHTSEDRWKTWNMCLKHACITIATCATLDELLKHPDDIWNKTSKTHETIKT
jgi:hypothetical protein